MDGASVRQAHRSLLLVEDEALIALATRQTLEELGYRVEVAHRGEDAVQYAVEDPGIELVLMDIDLGPGMDGTEAAQRILALRTLPIVFLSSHTERELVDRVRGITRYGYILKNSGTFVLNASIEMAFELFDAHRREEQQTARYEALVEAQPDLMFVMRGDGTYVEAYAPDPGALAVPADEIAGSHLRDIFGDEEANRHVGVYRKCLETGAVQVFEYELQLASDEPSRVFEARVSRLDADRVLAIVREVTESRRMQAELRRLADLQKTLVEVSTRCINLAGCDVSSATTAALETMGRGIGADRVYVFDYDFSRGVAVNSFEWCAPGIEPQIDELQSVPLEAIAEGVEHHRRGEAHFIADVDALPPGSMRDVLEPQGIRTLLTVPLMSRGLCTGAVGFDFVRSHHPFFPDERSLLAVFAEVLVNLRERDEAQERLRVLFDGARDNILIHEVGSDGMPGRYIDVNPSTCETLGYSREELLRMGPLDTTAADELDSIPQVMQELERGDHAMFEATGVRRDGSRVPFELSLHRANLRGREAVIAVSRDISKRRHAEAMQRLVSELAPVAICVHDRSRSALMFANPGIVDLVGYSADELASKTGDLCETLCHTEDRARLREIDEAVAADREGRVYEADVRLVRKDGALRWSRVRRAVLTRHGDGSPLQIITTALDITDRKEAEEIVTGLLSEKELLLREVHHRIKNNMLAIDGLLALQAASASAPEVAHALREAQSRLRTMTVLYDRLYRNDDTSSLPLSEYLPGLARKILDAHSDARSLVLRTDVPEVTLSVADTAALGMIVNEIVSNAIRHAFPDRAGGTISITGTTSGPGVSVRVEDDGVGYADAGDGTDSGGFGLLLVERLAAQHGFGVRTERDGGTAFVIEIGASSLLGVTADPESTG